MKFLCSLADDSDGATAIEYGAIAGLIAEIGPGPHSDLNHRRESERSRGRISTIRIPFGLWPPSPSLARRPAHADQIVGSYLIKTPEQVE